MAAIELNDTPLLADVNLLGYWRAEQNLTDSKGTFTSSGANVSYTTTNAKFNYGISFNGTNTQINLTNNGYSLNHDFTILGWVYIAGTSGNQCIFHSYFSSGTETYMELFTNHVTAGNVMRFNIYNGSGWSGFNSDTAISTGLHLIAVTYVRSSGAVVIYVDGEVKKSGSVAANFSSTCGIYLGSVSYPSTSGTVADDVAFFNRVLTSTEISGLYAGTMVTTTINYLKKFRRLSFQ